MDLIIKEKLEVVESLRQYLPRLKGGLLNMLENLQSGRDYLFLKDIGDVVEGIEWCISAIVLTKDIHIQVIDVGNINTLLKDMVDALENQDMILLGDILEYEIFPIIEEWDNIVQDKSYS